jgi:4-amino-4-deoxy-L-arabinose transferase-like glycosyltransferase
VRPAGSADRRTLLGIVGTLFVLQLVLAFLVLPHIEAHMSEAYGIDRGDFYDRIAKNLLRGDGYRFSHDTGPTLMREPGYPLFIAAICSLTGYSLSIVRLANILLASLSALIIARLTRHLSPNRWAYLLAPTLFLLHPGVVIAELRAGVEILFIFLLLCFFLALSRALRSGAIKDYLLAGVALGVVSSVRSTALLFPLLLPLFYLLWDRPSLRPRFALSRVAAVYVACFLVLTPWIVRNYALVGEFVATASVQGTAMHSGYYLCTHGDSPETTASLDVEAANVRAEIARQQGYQFKNTYYQIFYDPRDELAFNRYLSHWVIAQYASSPALFAKCATQNVFNFWFRGKDRTSTLANIAVQLPYLLLGLIGIFATRLAEPAVRGTLLLFLGYAFAIYLPILAQARYSVPLVPVLAIFAGSALAELLRRGHAPPSAVVRAESR